jgi:hypothetical protein
MQTSIIYVVIALMEFVEDAFSTSTQGNDTTIMRIASRN